MTNETDSFVNEVDENLRREQAVSLARRYGPWILGVFVALLVVIGGWQIWNQYSLDSSRRHAQTKIMKKQNHVLALLIILGVSPGAGTVQAATADAVAAWG